MFEEIWRLEPTTRAVAVLSGVCATGMPKLIATQNLLPLSF